MNTRRPRFRCTFPLLSCLLAGVAPVAPRLGAAETAAPATVYAEVVALDQPFMFNRLGAAQPQGMIFALKRDVVPADPVKPLGAGNAMLRKDKRARPIVLRVNVGDYLEIRFTNLLSKEPTNPANEPNSTPPIASLQPSTREAGVHITGMELVAVTGLGRTVQPGIESDATWVGNNPISLAHPGQTRIYKYYAKAEGTFMLYSAGADWKGQLQAGLFGAATVEPKNSEWYRSQVTHEDLRLAAEVVTAGDKPVLPRRPAASLLRKFAGDGRPLTAATDDGAQPLWTLAEVESARQTVHKAEVVIRGGHLFTPDGRPLVDYDAVYPPGHPLAGQPILRMTQRRADGAEELIYSDLTALITGPGAGDFPFTETGPDFYANPAYPSRRQPFREFTVMYHESFGTVQAFEQFYTPQLSDVMGAGTDAFAINYGSAGIGAEVLASRLGVGPMGGKQSVDLKFEEFFLSSWACGDPAMVVDVPANTPNNTVTDPSTGSKQINSQIVSNSPNIPPGPPTPPPTFAPLIAGKKATKAFYPDDPSNVYHSYMRDHVTIRLLHAGGGITHVHHLHAHQWLRSPNSDNSHYLDSQMITPGSTFTLEIAYNGSGNRNETVGDSIFHCHFYPHFAGGMWALWRVHDVFEDGTKLDDSGRPLIGPKIWNRALPDGEIATGTPIPAIVPLPTLAMAPAPAPVQLIDDGTRVAVAPSGTAPDGQPTFENPGYPFFVPGVSGHRAPHPPIDFAWEEEKLGEPKLDANGKKIYLDGGLPRHQVLDGTIVHELHTRWDFSKDFIARDKNGKAIAGGLVAFELPEEGTDVEKAAMASHSQRSHPSVEPNGDPGNFTLNGLPPVPGAPFANPSVDDDGNAQINTRRYQGAAIQLDVVLNKQGWHFPQQRFLSLWEDVRANVRGDRAPQPLFFRANTGESIEFWHTNLVPDYYELDDFQVRTPTDIIGQHIHLVKFDVLASDGAGNGWNYEDGTFSPDEVRARVDAINLSGGLFNFDPKTQFKGTSQRTLAVKPAPDVFGPPPAGQDWAGAQTTIQRWDTDPLENNEGEDRTLRTVFTHDHFGPSTHQQVGLYGGLLVEPEGSKWYDSVSGGLLYDTSKRRDGGPTTWQANIVTAKPADSYREFALEFGDFQLAYTSGSPSQHTKPTAPLFTTNLSLPPTTSTIAPSVSSVAPAFAASGVDLSPGATLSASGQDWILNNPTAPGVVEKYTIHPVGASAPGVFQIFPQDQPAGWSAPAFAINPPPADGNAVNNGAPYIPSTNPPIASGGPYPTLISAFGGVAPGTYSLNYRNEPVVSRVANPNPPTSTVKLPPQQTDLAFAYASIPRANPLLNVQPIPGTAISAGSNFKFPANLSPTVNGAVSPVPGDVGKVQPTDPFTPMLRAYAGDKVQVRTLVGAHHNPHFFSMDGVQWFFEPGYANSGYRNHQPMGISEHYEMLFDLPSATAATPQPFADYLYNASAGQDGVANGLWGIMRSYEQKVDQLAPLPNNPPGDQPTVVAIQPPPGAKIRRYHVVATTAQQAIDANGVVYNSRGQATNPDPLKSKPTFNTQKILQPNALLYVRAEDLDNDGKLKKDVPIEPLILRAAAGEWIELTLTNAFEATEPAFTTTAAAPSPFQGETDPALNVQLTTSTSVGLNPQVVGYDVTAGDGTNVGFNPTVTVAPGQTSAPIYWYAGTVSQENGRLKTTPVEFGGINLNPADPLQQPTLGLVGGLVIEPAGSTWQEDANMRAAATVTKADGTTFRDFVMICQDSVTLQQGIPTPPAAPTASTNHAVNYRTEPFNYRFAANYAKTFAPATANALVGGDPQTPIYTAPAGSEVRFHMLHPAGAPGADGEVLAIDGHVFQEEPYQNEGRTIAPNPLSQWFGARGGHGARDRFEAVIASAGGEQKVPGDYLYRSLITLLGGGDFASGTWGIFRVTGGVFAPTAATVTAATLTTEVAAEAPATGAAEPAETPEARRYHLRGRPADEFSKERPSAAPKQL